MKRRRKWAGFSEPVERLHEGRAECRPAEEAEDQRRLDREEDAVRGRSISPHSFTPQQQLRIGQRRYDVGGLDAIGSRQRGGLTFADRVTDRQFGDAQQVDAAGPRQLRAGIFRLLVVGENMSI